MSANPLRFLALSLIRKYFPQHFKVGDIVTGPRGRGRVLIMGGQYMGTYGLSNFWYWRSVDGKGRPYGPERHGYGWKPLNAALPVQESGTKPSGSTARARSKKKDPQP